MPPSRSCRRLSSMLVGEGGPAGGTWVDAQALEQRVAALAAGLKPDFVEPEEVAIGVPVGALADLVQRIHQRLEFCGQLGKYAGQHALAAAGGRLGKRPVGAPTHGDVVVNVDQLRGEALREEAGD